MKFLTLLTFLGIALSVPAQWVHLNNMPSHKIDQMCFTSRSVGYAVAYYQGRSPSEFLKTTDAGRSWTKITLDTFLTNNGHIQSFDFINDSVGFLVLVKNGIPPKYYVMRTNDGGYTWSDISPAQGSFHTADQLLDFVDDQTGFITSSKHLFKTTDGGALWTKTPLSNQYITDLKFVDANNGIIGTWDGTFNYRGNLFTTINGGGTWDSLVLHTSGSQISSVSIPTAYSRFGIDANSWLYDQKLYRSYDSGNSWDTLVFDFFVDTFDVAEEVLFINDAVGYLCTQQGYIYESLDSGASWSSFRADTFSLTHLAHFENSVYVSGDLNKLFSNDITFSINPPLLNDPQTLYPNPTQGDQNIFLLKAYTGDIRVIDIQGQLVLEQNLRNSNEIKIEQLRLNPGMYWVIGDGVKMPFVVQEN